MNPSITLISLHRLGQPLDPANQQLVAGVDLKINRSGLPVLQVTRGKIWGIATLLTDAIATDAVDLKVTVLNTDGNHVVSFHIEGLTPEIVYLLSTGVRTQTSNSNQVTIQFSHRIQTEETKLAHWTANPGAAKRADALNVTPFHGAN